MKNTDLHKRHLAKIHLLKKQLGLDDDTYRALLQTHGGHGSAKDMNAQQKVRVINWMASCVQGKKAAEEFGDRPSLFNAINGVRRQLRRHPNYVSAIAERMFANSDLTQCSVIELGMILTALREQQQREAA